MIALLLVDIQYGLDQSEYWGGTRNNPQAETNCRKILDYFRSKSWPLFHIQHCSRNPDSPLYPGKEGQGIKAIVTPLPGETVIKKKTNSAFVDTPLADLLKSAGLTGLIVIGLTTDHCVSATVRSAADLGYSTTLVADACATYAKTGVDGQVFSAEVVHSVALASLQGEFAQIRNTDSLLRDLENTGSSDYI
jgi:nicotinamidase-related amidase